MHLPKFSCHSQKTYHQFPFFVSPVKKHVSLLCRYCKRLRWTEVGGTLSPDPAVQRRIRHPGRIKGIHGSFSLFH